MSRRFRKPLVGSYVYRFRNADGVLLYVGIAQHLTYRLIQHAADSPFFFPGETAIEITEYPTYAEAMRAEAEAIRTEHPRWNVIGRDHWGHPDGAARSHLEVADKYPGTYREIGTCSPASRRVVARRLARNTP